MPEGDLPPFDERRSADLATEQMPFKLKDLERDALDPRGRKVRDILWCVDEFKIYKTDQGISPFFSDNPALAREQKLAYLALGPDLAAFNHLINTLKPNTIPFTEQPIGVSRLGSTNLEHYERELARCIAQALLGQAEIARASLTDLRQRLADRISNRGRVVHLMINLVLVFAAIAASIAFVAFEYQSVYNFEEDEIGLAIMMGCVGALFSTTVRLQSMSVDPTVSPYMHWVYGAQRIVVGALGALIIYIGFKSGLVNGILQPVDASFDAAPKFNIYWLSFVSVLAGFSERLVPNLLDAKATSINEGAS